MAKIRIPSRGKGVEAYTRIAMKPGVNTMSEWSMDARRAMILGKRLVSGDLIGVRAPNTSDHSIIDPLVEKLEEKKSNETVVGENTGTHSNFINNKDQKVLNDFVAIIDIDAGGYNKDYETITLPFIPRELSYDPQSNFVAIKPIGRNTSKYQFTGSEDILEFEIDWYANDYNRREVIERCRRIESLSKSDGYQGDPHRVMLYWGEGDILFKDHVFIVLSAKYKLSHFNKGYLDRNNNIVSTNMLPIQAYQTVRLGRISSNSLTKHQIEYVKLPELTSIGISTPAPNQELRF